MRYSVIFIYILLPVLAWGGMYEGRVVDGTTQAPIKGAQLVNGRGEKVLTDASGRFRLETEDPQVRVQLQGFQTKEETLQPGGTIIALYPYDVYELSQYVVTAEKDRELIEISKQELSREAIQQTTVALFPDIAKTVQLLPGVTTNSDFSSLLFVRGGDPNEVLAILDDMIILQPYIWGGQISIFNPNLVENLDFYSGGFSAEWPQAMSGILKVENKTGNPEKYQGFIDLSATTLDVFLEGPCPGPQESSFLLGLRRTHYDLIVGLFLQDENLVFPYFYDGQLKVTMPFGNNLISVNSIYSFEGMDMVIKPEEGYSSANARESEFLYENLNMYFSLTSDWQVLENVSTLTLLGFYHNQGGYTYDDAFTPFNMDRKQWILQLRHLWQWDTGWGHVLRSGLYHFPAKGEATLESSLRLPTGNNTYYEETLKTEVEMDWLSFTGWFVQDEITLLEQFLFLNPSVNLQYYTPTRQWLTNPRCMLKLLPTPGWEITLSSGIYSQYPISANQIDDTLGNPALRAEDAWHYVLGTKVYLQQDLTVQVDGYYKDYRNLIVSDADPDIKYTNHGRGYAYGLDFMLKKELGGKWDGWLTYSWVTSRRRIDQRTDPATLGMPEDNTPLDSWYAPTNERPHTLNLIINYNLKKKWKLALTQRISSGRLYTPIIGGEYQPAINEYTPVYGEYNSARYPAYASTDIKLTMPLFGLPNGYSYIQISNLLNLRNVNNYQYKNDYSDKRAINQLPSLFIGGVHWEF